MVVVNYVLFLVVVSVKIELLRPVVEVIYVDIKRNHGFVMMLAVWDVVSRHAGFADQQERVFGDSIG